MATFNHKIEVVNGNSTDIYHPETNSTQVYDFTNEKWLNSIIGVLSTLTTTQKGSLVEALNEIASKKTIEVVDEIPTNLEGKSVLFEKQGELSDAPDKPSTIVVETRTNDPISPAIGRIWLREDL
ncbi:hypothetical protein NSQ62_07695 [Solibacillus sp. FSL H8-0523]|uniref:hypothetical protein n=1 Tax=Solibacillus sp. FSL H8-0523 TaxID=2954511 RepID=UPI003100DF22